MKRLFLSLALAGSLSALAAPEKVLTLRVADTSEIISAVSRVGEFIGNPMLVLPLAAGITANPAAQVLGPARAGATTTVCVYADPELVDFDALAKSAYVTLLYPVTPEKYAVLKDNPEALKKDGAHVVFSEDGAWAGVSNDPTRARTALDGIAAAQAPLAGDVLRAELTPAGVSAATRLVDTVLREMAADDVKAAARIGELVGYLRQVKDTTAALRVDASGITIRTAAHAVPGSELAGLKPAPLAPDAALAFAGPDAVYAAAWSADCGQLDVADLDRACSKIAALFDKLGLKTDWATYTKAGSARKLTFDFDGCVKYFTTEGKAKFEALDPEATLREFEGLKLGEARSLTLKNPAGALAFALKGADTQATPSMRFARVAPEAAAKKPYTVGAASLYAICRTLAPKAAALLPDDERASVQPLLATLPPSGKGGFAAYAWQADDASWQGVLRVSPDEIKGLSACFNVAAGYMMMQQMKAMEMETPDEEDGAEDED